MKLSKTASNLIVWGAVAIGAISVVRPGPAPKDPAEWIFIALAAA